jgi:predicted ATPase
MRIDQIKIENIRALRSFEAAFHSEFNVIVGENAKGKTTILEMLSKFMKYWHVHEAAGPMIDLEDITSEVILDRGLSYKEVADSARFQVQCLNPLWDERLLSWERVAGVEINPPSNDDARHKWLSDSIQQAKPLPLMAFFSPFREMPEEGGGNFRLWNSKYRYDGYKKAFDLHAEVGYFIDWFATLELSALQEGVKFDSLELVREAVARCLPGCTDIRFIVRQKEVMIRRAGEGYEPLRRLSDGYRTMAALVGELAWRAATLNPEGEGGTPTGVRGVVLIDELDLHLHPSWQRRVVRDLQAAFPKVQWITSTHSPFIIQSVDRGQIINLDRETGLDVHRKSIEDIAEVEMGVPNVQRSEAFQEKVRAAQEYLRLLDEPAPDEGKLQELKARLDALQERFGYDPVYVASLLQKRAAKGIP